MHPALLIVGAGPEPMLADVEIATLTLTLTLTLALTLTLTLSDPNPNQVELAISALRRGGGHAPQQRMIRLTHSM